MKQRVVYSKSNIARREHCMSVVCDELTVSQLRSYNSPVSRFFLQYYARSSEDKDSPAWGTLKLGIKLPLVQVVRSSRLRLRLRLSSLRLRLTQTSLLRQLSAGRSMRSMRSFYLCVLSMRSMGGYALGFIFRNRGPSDL